MFIYEDIFYIFKIDNKSSTHELEERDCVLFRFFKHI